MIKLRSRLGRLGAGIAAVALVTSGLALSTSGGAQAQAKAMAAANPGHANVAASTVVPATSANASAIPYTTLPQCNTTYALRPCVQVFGSGLHIDKMNGWTHNESGVEISGSFWNELYYDRDNVRPGGGTGYRGILNCSFLSISAGGNTANCDWAPNANEAAGYYCDALWQSVNHRPGLWSYRCVYVHS
jgi:hypothetical protein